MVVRSLHQPSSANPLDVECVACRAGRDLKDPHILFGGKYFECLSVVSRGQQYLYKLLRSDGLCRGHVYGAVEGNDAAKGGGGSGFVRLLIRLFGCSGN